MIPDYTIQPGPWPFVLESPLRHLLRGPRQIVEITAWSHSQVVGTIRDGLLTLHTGYAIDGASFSILARMLNVPRRMAAWFVHDFGCQFQGSEEFRRHAGDRRYWDRQMRAILRVNRDWIAEPAYRAVRLHAQFSRPNLRPLDNITVSIKYAP